MRLDVERNAGSSHNTMLEGDLEIKRHGHSLDACHFEMNRILRLFNASQSVFCLIARQIGVRAQGRAGEELEGEECCS